MKRILLLLVPMLAIAQIINEEVTRERDVATATLTNDPDTEKGYLGDGTKGQTIKNDFLSSYEIDMVPDDTGRTRITPVNQPIVTLPERCADDNKTHRFTIINYRLMQPDEKYSTYKRFLPNNQYIGTTYSYSKESKYEIRNARCYLANASRDEMPAQEYMVCGACSQAFNPYNKKMAIGIRDIDQISDKALYDSIYESNRTLVNSALLKQYENKEGAAKGMEGAKMLFSSGAFSFSLSSLVDGKVANRDYILNNSTDTNETNFTRIAQRIKGELLTTMVQDNVVKCFAKRKMIPKFYCPLTGYEYGVRTGGDVNGSMEKAKQECDAVCRSTPASCLAIDDKAPVPVTSSSTVVLRLEESADNVWPKVVTLPVSSLHRVKSLGYDIRVNYASDTNLSMPPHHTMRYSLSATRTFDGSNRVMPLKNMFRLRFEGENAHMDERSIPVSDSVSLTFYRPVVDGMMDVNTSFEEQVESIVINNFRVEYEDLNYYFCPLTQVVANPNNCRGGQVFRIGGAEDVPIESVDLIDYNIGDSALTDGSAESSTFYVCKNAFTQNGGEPLFGAFYTRDSCEENCYIHASCQETYEDYAITDTGENYYEIEIGCTDDQLNKSCTPEMCRDYFNNHVMPVQEVVYARSSNRLKTVDAGVEVPGVIRPRVDISAESTAASSSDSSAAYDDLFTDTMKDQAYTNMLANRTFTRVQAPIGMDTLGEFALRVVSRDKSINDGYYGAKEREYFIQVKPPASYYGSGREYYLYIVAAIEQQYKPEDGIYLEAGGDVVYEGVRPYKDLVFANLRLESAGVTSYFEAFYRQEAIQTFSLSYAEQLAIEQAIAEADEQGVEYMGTEYEDGVWQTNLLAKKSLVEYAAANRLLNLQGEKELTPFRTVTFSKAQNYFEYRIGVDLLQAIDQRDGLVMKRQRTLSDRVDKEYSSANKDKTAATLSRMTLYAFLSDTRLNNRALVEQLRPNASQTELLVNPSNLIYDAHTPNKYVHEIAGDGIASKQIKVFEKGLPTSTTLSAQFTPRIQDEGRDVILFMYLFKEEE